MKFLDIIKTKEKTAKFTQPNELKKLIFVCQNSKSVKWTLEGLESFCFFTIWRNLKPNEFVMVFDENKTHLGYMVLESNGIPQRYLETELSVFSDWYEEAK